MTEIEKLNEIIAIQKFIIWLNQSKDLWLRNDNGTIHSTPPLLKEYEETQNED
jgi:hypothetical protein